VIPLKHSTEHHNETAHAGVGAVRDYN
jgi:hypothetical protein